MYSSRGRAAWLAREIGILMVVGSQDGAKLGPKLGPIGPVSESSSGRATESEIYGAGDGNRNCIPIHKSCVLAALPSSVSNGAKSSQIRLDEVDKRS